MNDPHDPLADPISEWLDAVAEGESPPATGQGSDPDLDSLRASASRFHALARAGERYAAAVSPLPDTWEDLMSINAPTMDSTYEHQTRTMGAVKPVSSEEGHGRFPLRNLPWNQTANILLAAALILAVSAGIWRATGGVSFGIGGGPPDQPTVPFGGFVNQDATPEVSAVDPAAMPKAEDCTVQPLTVDEVIHILQQRNPSTGWFPSIATPRNSATPGSDPAIPGDYPTEVQITDVTAVQQMWKSCALAKSWFQMWAVETPALVQEQVLKALPPLTGEQEARSLLESLEDGELVDGFSIPRPYTMLNFIDPDPLNSWLFDQGFLIAGFRYYDQDGTYRGSRSAQESQIFSEMTGGNRYSCGVYVFGLSEDLQSWLLNEVGTGCG